MLKTGRTKISPEELSALLELEKIHTPQRVNREIAEAVRRFQLLGRSLPALTLIYIYKSLQFQNSRKYVKRKLPPGEEFEEDELPDPYAGAYL